MSLNSGERAKWDSLEVTESFGPDFESINQVRGICVRFLL